MLRTKPGGEDPEGANTVSPVFGDYNDTETTEENTENIRNEDDDNTDDGKVI